MENIVKYSGGGGAVQRAFVRDVKAVYKKMLRDPREQQMDGFGEWEFLGLVGGLLINEARDVHSAFIDRWDFEDTENPNFHAAQDAERRRIIWRGYRRDREAYSRLRAASGLQSEPQKPWEDEPQDLDRFIEDLQTRFRLSTSENLSAIQNFRTFPGEYYGAKGSSGVA